MISSDNLPINLLPNDEDFTIQNYQELLKLAKLGWKILDYRNIQWDENFIVWRHDVDYSLNCSLKLAKIEQKEGVKSTYFINPHSEFYNVAELSQYEIVKEILSLGHDIGLHFDGAFHEVKSECELDVLVAKESSYLEDLFGVKPSAFSFHNPVSENLECEADEYGKLKNCYSKRFKKEVGYCSDSNGYWRFRRLYEVLKEGKDRRLQVLTHPGWWQDEPAPPRQKIFRAVYGRAEATMSIYDRGLDHHGRFNNAGDAQALGIIRELKPDEYELCDYLWSRSNFKTLFLKLWCLQEMQINQMSKFFLRKIWNVTESEINRFFADEALMVNGCDLFDSLFSQKLHEVSFFAKSEYEFWIQIRNQLMLERSYLQEPNLVKGCLYLCSIIKSLAEWGISQDFEFDGFTKFDSIDLSGKSIADPKSEKEGLDQMQKKAHQKWPAFKKKIKSIKETYADSALR
jgi:hypothetical protein